MARYLIEEASRYTVAGHIEESRALTEQGTDRTGHKIGQHKEQFAILSSQLSRSDD
jgi:hypothetical protein